MRSQRLIGLLVSFVVVLIVGACSTDEDVALESALPTIDTGSVSRPPVDSVNPSRQAARLEDFDQAAHIQDIRDMFSRLYQMTDFPDVEVVRVVWPEDFPHHWQQCMLEAGWNVSIGFDGGLTVPADLVPDQQSAYLIDDFLCTASIGQDFSVIGSFGDVQIRALFDYYVNTLVPCLEVQGFSQGEVPSWQAFRESWVYDEQAGTYFAGLGSWAPYDFVPLVDENNLPTMTDEEWVALNAACPQSPPFHVLWPVEP